MKKVTLVTQILGAACLVSSLGVLMTGCGSDSAVNTNPTSVMVPSNTTAKPTVNANIIVSSVPSAQTVKAGDNFDIAIRAQNAQPSRGIQFAMSWDPAKVECVSAEQGSYFQEFVKANKGSLFQLPDPAGIDNAAGIFPKVSGKVKQLNIVMVEAKGPGGDWLGVTGTGDIYILHMKVKDGVSGTAEFKLSDVILIDATMDSDDMHATVQNGKITISP